MSLHDDGGGQWSERKMLRRRRGDAGAMSQGFIGLADGGVWCYCLLRIVV